MRFLYHLNKDFKDSFPWFEINLKRISFLDDLPETIILLLAFILVVFVEVIVLNCVLNDLNSFNPRQKLKNQSI